MRDILVQNGDLCFGTGTGDFLFAEGVEAVKQQRVRELIMPLGDNVSDPTEGSTVFKLVKSDNDVLKQIELKREIKRIIKKDKNIKSDSIVIIADKGSIVVSFETNAGIKAEVEV